MKRSDDEYIDLKKFITYFIKRDKNKGIEIKLENIDEYINQAIISTGIECDEETKTMLYIDIEYQEMIVHHKGHAIFEEYNNKRDWYTNASINDDFFWARYKEYLLNNTSMSPRSINLLDNETLPDIMNCLGNPNEVFEGKRFRRGLIIGDVQSGKTATYTGLICKAADAGYKVVILLAGITESLRQQTQERIDEGIVGLSRKKEGKKEVFKNVGVGKDNKPKRATSFTSCINDFTGNCHNITMTLASQNSLVLFVVKKNVSVLRKLHQWLEEQNINPITGYVDVPMLLIDDEADNASVNTKKDETDPAQTNKLIRKICQLFKNSTYVGFTATPFANVFINPDSVDEMNHEDLFPRHFIYALESPSNYVGAQKIFYSDGMYYRNLRFINDINEPDYTSEEYKEDVQFNIDELNAGTFYYRHKKEWNGILPDSLRESVLCFFIANVIRDLRGEISTPRSMLINMTRFVKVQKVIANHVEEIYENVFNDIRFNFSDEDSENKNLSLYIEFNDIWHRHFDNITDIEFKRVVNKTNILNSIENIQIMVVNGSRQSNKLDYKANKSLRVIAVGGLALSRGLTLEGLLVSYFYRNTSTFDVLMQMGRWFGYRTGYEDLFQIWTSRTSALWYAEVAQASQELKDDIRDMFDQRLTPKDFGIKVRDNCDELQITASNKMRNASSIQMQYSFYGNIYDTPYITYNVGHNKHNLSLVSKLASSLKYGGFDFKYADFRKEDKDVYDYSDGSSRYYSDVPKYIIKNFIEQIRCSMANPRFETKNICDFLEDENNVGLDKWDVVFSGGESSMRYNFEGIEMINCLNRAIYDNNKNVVQISARRRVLTGGSEGKFTLSKDSISLAEKRCRDLWERNGENSKGRNIPVRAYFEHLPNRKPVMVIMLIEPNKPTEKEEERLTRFRNELGDDCIVAFAIGCPGIMESGKAVKYKVNKVYQQLNIEGEEPEEDEDE